MIETIHDVLATYNDAREALRTALTEVGVKLRHETIADRRGVRWRENGDARRDGGPPIPWLRLDVDGKWTNTHDVLHEDRREAHGMTFAWVNDEHGTIYVLTTALRVDGVVNISAPDASKGEQ